MTTREKFTAEFVKAVAEMRAEQTKFFRTRQQIHLMNSKALEKTVDGMVREFQLGSVPAAGVNKQEQLF